MSRPPSSNMSLAQWDMYERIIERSKTRNVGWTIKLVKKFPDLTRLNTRVVVGFFSYSCPSLKTRWVQRETAVNNGGVWCTPGDLARDYLAIKYKDRGMHVTTAQYQKVVKDRAIAPRYCEPGRIGKAVYLDLTSAYWRIMRAIGWNVDYNPRKWLIGGESMTDFPYFEHKLARNCMVSSSLPNAVRVWDGQDMIQERKPNGFINMVLWTAVMDILNGVAVDMLKVGARYIYTDGYIIPEKKLAEAQEILAVKWGLSTRVKRVGSVHIKAPGSYSFDETESNGERSQYATVPYLRSNREYPFNNVYNPGSEWLRERFQELAEVANEDWSLWDETKVDA